MIQNIANTKTKLKELKKCVNAQKELACHRDNLFNRHYTRLLSLFSDLQVTVNRLDENTKKIDPITNIIQFKNLEEDRFFISDEGQKLRNEWVKLSLKMQTDLKALYLFSKIFIDDFVGLVVLILDIKNKGILFTTKQGGYSVGVFYRSLIKYSGTNMVIRDFIIQNLDVLKAVEVYLSAYRNNYIQHLDTTGVKETKWTSHSHDGSIKFLGSRSSLTPKELTFVVHGCIEKIINFILEMRLK